MADAVEVEAARIPDRDRLLRELCGAGLDAHPIAEVGIEVRYADGQSEATTTELFAHAEHVLMSIGAPFVPMKHEGTISILSPLS